jgi:hypothetical protein
MDWNINKAKDCLLTLGMDHIKDGLFLEGGELVYESRWGTGFETEAEFRNTIKDICWWDEEDIDAFVKEKFNV